MNIAMISYGVASLGYLVLSVLLLISAQWRLTGILLIVASVLSTCWAIMSTVSAGQNDIPFYVLFFLELARNLSLILFLLSIASPNFPKLSKHGAITNWIHLGAVGLIIVTVVVFALLSSGLLSASTIVLGNRFLLTAMMTMSIMGLMLIEQVFRSTQPSRLQSIKHLCIGLGGIYAFDFFMYADAVLFNNLDHQIWAARGFINALAIPFLATSVARNPSWELDIHVSREVVVHSLTIIGAGIYLLIMALAGYLIRLYGASWGAVIQTTFFAAALLLLVFIVFSNRLRAHSRVLLSKHFFSNKYDYRREWLNFTTTLSQSEEDVPHRIIAALVSLIDSPGGLLWATSAHGEYNLIAAKNFELPEAINSSDLKDLKQYYSTSKWLIDLDEVAEFPNRYEGLELPRQILNSAEAWLIVPLPFKDDVIGCVLIARSSITKSINWEDRDLLKMAGFQAASLLAQHQLDKALVEARQFEAFNKLSAYIVHDLKNILGQQSLIVSNAEQHKSNPEFVDDVIRTIDNSVSRMKLLLEQLRSGARTTDRQDIQLSELLHQVINKRSVRQPIPIADVLPPELIVRAEPEQLGVVFGHIIQNAQEATDPETGEINVSLRSDERLAITTITDNGHGMDANFISNRLFQPFDSTKGLTGMGIGAFESREFIRELGGDITVTSDPHKYTVFKITIPLAKDSTVASD